MRTKQGAKFLCLPRPVRIERKLLDLLLADMSPVESLGPFSTFANHFRVLSCKKVDEIYKDVVFRITWLGWRARVT